ncbi:hypothetical protein COSO111634_31190 [Corallococcus soli]
MASRPSAETISASTRERSDQPISDTVPRVRAITTAESAAVKRAARLSVIRNGYSVEGGG